jgi:spermidine synthase
MEVGFGAGGSQFESPNRSAVLELFASYAAQASDLGQWMADAQINRDRDLRLQYLAGMWFNSYKSTSILQSILSNYRFPENLVVGSTEQKLALKQMLANEGRRDR